MDAVLDDLDAASTAVRDIDLGRVDVDRLKAGVLRLQRVIAHLQVTQAGWLHELETRAAFAASADRDAVSWLASSGRTTRGVARRQAELGRALNASPVLADAVTAGEISPDAAVALVPTLSAPHSGDIADLVDACRGATPGQARAAGSRFQALNPPIGSTAKEREHALREKRCLRVTDNGDGTSDIHGTLTTVVAAAVMKVLKSLIAKPVVGDDRSYEQKLADALVQAGHVAGRARIGSGRGNLPTILITIDLFDLINNTGYGVTSTGDILSAEQVRRLTANAHLQRVLLADSVVLDEGRRVRLGTDDQWRALVARDGGCRFGCDLPPEWCQVDHIREWDADHGPTDIDWLVLFCSYHHHFRHRPDVHLRGDVNTSRSNSPTAEPCHSQHAAPPPKKRPHDRTDGRDRARNGLSYLRFGYFEPVHIERNMMSTDEKTTADLVKTLKNGEEGFRTAAEKLADSDRPELGAEFRGYSEQRARFAAELDGLAGAYGDDVPERTTVPGALHRGWIAVKDALTGSSPEAVLKAAVTGEDHAVEEYDDALKADISPGLRTVLTRQQAEVVKTRDRVKELAEQS